MQHDLALAAVDLEVGENDVHVRVVIPGVTGHGLIVPDILSRVRIECDDRAQEEIVTSIRASDLPVPGRAVAGADVELIEFGVIGEAMPGVAAATVAPPLSGPRLRGHRHRVVLEAVRRVARHDPEAPSLLAGLGVIGRYVAPVGTVLGSTVADEHLAFEDLRRASDVHGQAGLDGVHAPELPAGRSVHCVQAPVPRRDIDLVVPVGDSAAVVPPHSEPLDVVTHLRVVFPNERPRRGIDRPDPVHASDEVHDSLDHERSGGEPAILGQLEHPVRRQLRYVRIVDLRERTKPQFTRRATECEPVLSTRLVGHRDIVDNQPAGGFGRRVSASR